MKKGIAVPSLEHQWVKATETDYPEFYVRLTPYYPRFCKPFSFYHTHVAPPRKGTVLISGLRDGQMLKTVTVRSKHGGLHAFDSSHPAITRDAYQIFNECVDAGFTPGWFAGKNPFSKWVERLLVGDMNMHRQYMTYEENHLRSYYEGLSSRKNRSFSRGDTPTTDGTTTQRYAWEDPIDPYLGWLNTDKVRFNANLGWNTSNRFSYSFTGMDDATIQLDYLHSLRSVNLITDYAPRMEGSPRYTGTDQPTVDVGFNLLTDGKRITYRDRHFILQGFDVSQEFYSPCYRNRPLPDTKDYRRTLYWNPNLELDKKGCAHVTLWNNSTTTSISVSAEGITPTGKILTCISYPEDR